MMNSVRLRKLAKATLIAGALTLSSAALAAPRCTVFHSDVQYVNGIFDICKDRDYAQYCLKRFIEKGDAFLRVYQTETYCTNVYGDRHPISSTYNLISRLVETVRPFLN